MKRVLQVFILLTLSVATVNAQANESYRVKQKRFVRMLYDEKRYFDCIAEARRLQVEDKSPELDYFIYMNYYLSGEFRTVAAGYDYSDSEPGLFPGILVSMSFLQLGMYDDSYEVLGSYSYTGDLKRDRQLFIYRLKPLLLSGNLSQIESEGVAAEKFLSDDYNFTSLREDLALFRNEGMKSPLKSAFMSAIVPGLGQLYSGYPLEGLISMASVAITAMGGLYARNSGKDGYSCTLFFFSGLFHAGNIYGAWNSAERRNSTDIKREYELIEKRFGGYNPEDGVDLERVLN